jgi:hypothetical protein
MWDKIEVNNILKYCQNCGAKLREDARFCEKCGTDVSNIEIVTKKSLEDIEKDLREKIEKEIKERQEREYIQEMEKNIRREKERELKKSRKSQVDLLMVSAFAIGISICLILLMIIAGIFSFNDLIGQDTINVTAYIVNIGVPFEFMNIRSNPATHYVSIISYDYVNLILNFIIFTIIFFIFLYIVFWFITKGKTNTQSAVVEKTRKPLIAGVLLSIASLLTLILCIVYLSLTFHNNYMFVNLLFIQNSSYLLFIILFEILGFFLGLSSGISCFKRIYFNYVLFGALFMIIGASLSIPLFILSIPIWILSIISIVLIVISKKEFN